MALKEGVGEFPDVRGRRVRAGESVAKAFFAIEIRARSPVEKGGKFAGGRGILAQEVIDGTRMDGEASGFGLLFHYVPSGEGEWFAETCGDEASWDRFFGVVILQTNFPVGPSSIPGISAPAWQPPVGEDGGSGECPFQDLRTLGIRNGWGCRMRKGRWLAANARHAVFTSKEQEIESLQLVGFVVDGILQPGPGSNAEAFGGTGVGGGV